MTDEEILKKRQEEAKADQEAGREVKVELPNKKQPEHPSGDSRRPPLTNGGKNNPEWGKKI